MKKEKLISDEMELLLIKNLKDTLDISDLKLFTESGKVIAGIVCHDELINNITKFNLFIRSINDLYVKTCYSIKQSLNIYKKINYDDFDLFNVSFEENEAIYYLENSLFRLFSLWDSLAHLYNIYFDLKLDLDKVGYRKVIEKLKKDFFIKDIQIGDIYKYINLKPDSNHIHNHSIEEFVHYDLSQLRNQYTHRYSIAMTSMSSLATLKVMPDTLYKISLDLKFVSNLIEDVSDLIIRRMLSN